MSYCILYRSAFIRLSDGTYIPIDETGDNNVWEAGNTRRARSWSNGWSFFREKLSYSSQEISDTIKKRIQKTIDRYTTEGFTEKEIRDNYGNFTSLARYGSRKITAGEYARHFLNGIEHAKTVQELLDIGIRTKLDYYDKENKFHRIWISDEKELVEKYNALNGKADAWVGYCSIDNYTYRKHFTKTLKKPADKKTYTVKFQREGSECFFLRREKSRVFFSYFPTSARVFTTKASATSAANRLNKSKIADNGSATVIALDKTA